MPTQLKYNTSLTKNANLALLVASGEAAQLSELQPEEQAYVQQQVQQESKLILLNRYSHRVYVVVAPEAKTDAARNEAVRQAGSTLLKQLKADKVEEIVLLDKTGTGAGLYLAEGLYLSNYTYFKHKTKDVKPSPLQRITIADASVTEAQVQELAHVLEAVIEARNLVNEPHSHQSATQFSEQLEELADAAGFKIEVLDEIKIQTLKMGGLLAVNQGSEEPPTFNILEWKPEGAKNTKPYVLVGKGVVYDTGGLSLKPTPQSMDYMKSDMAGAAAVAGILYAVAKNKLPLHVIGLIPATDNRPGGQAVAPGDVITMHNGMTVEVLNTDAEGRLILADALSFAKKYDPELVLDFATLTGAAMRAIGKEASVAMGTAGDETVSALKKAGENVHERLVEFPLWDEYKKQIESDVADLKNLGGADAGAITAGKFLEAFTSYPWMHFDIAGTAYLHSEDSYRGKLGTGTGVRLVYNYLSALAQ
ncbi:leucyl aminopeptidase family protein [Pontibacter akesuensis]|uniref:Probable cytosol aminopeptidase n=1 Tax=Pontibacter akesuensis TaxID=388950 RepID=A0A1I7GJ77_9BACT|nr:leucyl aminopeptidase [Pontibacter akesuensis]GHA56514.1 putative cytosol aminopeptidase [Pontibacter akesuensis]SFU48469.1 leucyl aminopeptidase [Pontibacter akesuensis]